MPRYETPRGGAGRKRMRQPVSQTSEVQKVFSALLLFHGLAEEPGIQREVLMRWVLERLGGNAKQLMTAKAYQLAVKGGGAVPKAKKVAIFKQVVVPQVQRVQPARPTLRRRRGRPRKYPQMEPQPPAAAATELTPDEAAALAEALDDALV
jgi:hypothetical protein